MRLRNIHIEEFSEDPGSSILYTQLAAPSRGTAGAGDASAMSDILQIHKSCSTGEAHTQQMPHGLSNPSMQHDMVHEHAYKCI